MSYRIYRGGEIVTDQDLQHWKYLRKYKNKNGNWTYVYARKSTLDQINLHNRIADKDEEYADLWDKQASQAYKKGNLEGSKWIQSNADYNRDEAKYNRDIANHLIESASDEPIAKFATKVSKKLQPAKDFINGSSAIGFLGKKIYMNNGKLTIR